MTIFFPLAHYDSLGHEARTYLRCPLEKDFSDHDFAPSMLTTVFAAAPRVRVHIACTYSNFALFAFTTFTKSLIDLCASTK